MKKIKSTTSRVIVMILLFSLICTPIFADQPNNPSVFDQYLTSKGYNVNSTTTKQENDSTLVQKGNLNSNEYIKILIDKGINFEVKDIYYKKADQIEPNNIKNNVIVDINGEKYVKVKEVVTVNALPAVASNVSGDTRVREVNEGSTQQIDSLSDDFDQFIDGVIMALVGYTHPVMGFVADLAGLFPYPTEQYGWVSAEVTNQYYYTNVWHEVFDFVGFIPMVITESRRTNVKYEQNVINKNTGKSSTQYKWYQAVYYEYSIYYGQLTRNLTEALNMYNAGLRNPEVYRYYTGRVIDNTDILP